MKVVINKCYGGFGLSGKAIKWLHQKNSKLIRVYHSDSEYYKDQMEFLRKLTSKKKEYLGDGYVSIEAIGETVIFEDTVMLSTVEYDMARDKFRSHDDLVAVVEALGPEEASGRYSELKVVEIPNYTDFEIEEYDGREWIAEKHKTWG